MRKMIRNAAVALAALAPFACHAQEPIELKTAPISLHGEKWAETVLTPFDKKHAEETYKVYTHLMDFAGEKPITKGAGGKFTHHRGLFIGWKDTMVDGRDYDTWHMSNCYQQAESEETAEGVQKLAIDWNKPNGKPFIKEQRTLTLSDGPDGARIIDFASHLESLEGDIELKGDLQHAGMQVRMSNEVSEHEESTQYILPEGAEELDDDKVVGAWWACASVEVDGKRYWVMHMTPPDLLTGEPVYSIRRYARFGAFFEPLLKADTPLDLKFRVLYTEKELDPAACQALYDAYAAGVK
ncbi:MAG: hypothetical protein GC168_20980 [Candidatus Hydrogenedens sp.]|nr:hypothetical protein [Candidatus Hydrogenedens sp.]